MFRTIQNREQFFRQIGEFKSSMGDRKKSVSESKHLWRDNQNLQAYLKGESVYFIDTVINQGLEVISPKYQINIFMFILSKRKDYFIKEIWRDNLSLKSAITKLSAADLKALLLKVMISSCKGTSPTIKEILELVTDVRVIKSVIDEISKNGINSNYKRTQVDVLNERLDTIKTSFHYLKSENPTVNTDNIFTHNELVPNTEITYDYHEKLFDMSQDVNVAHTERLEFNSASAKRKSETELTYPLKRQNTGILSQSIFRVVSPPVVLAPKPVEIQTIEIVQPQELPFETVETENAISRDANAVQPTQDFNFEKELDEIERNNPTLFGYDYEAPYASFTVTQESNLFDEDELINKYLNLK